LTLQHQEHLVAKIMGMTAAELVRLKTHDARTNFGGDEQVLDVACGIPHLESHPRAPAPINSAAAFMRKYVFTMSTTSWISSIGSRPGVRGSLPVRMHSPKCCSSSLKGLSCQLYSRRQGVPSLSIPCSVTREGNPRANPVGNDASTRSREPYASSVSLK